MYGMVNNALQEMVTARLNEEAWTEICRDANVHENYFLSLESYSDETTYNLFGNAAIKFGISLDLFLQEFGLFWIDFALKTSYGPLLKNAGNTLWETLNSLDSLHSHISLALPKLRPPSFSVINGSDATTVIYKSTRVGLAPFVIGLIHGLAAMHGEKVKVMHTKSKSETLDHDEFKVWYDK